MSRSFSFRELGRKQRVAQALNDYKADFIFIDGDHTVQ